MNKGYRILSSLDELEHEDLVKFYFYWDDLRGERQAPRTWDFDFLELPNIVKHMAVVEIIDGGTDAKTKFIGQSLVDQLYNDITGELVSSETDQPMKHRSFEIFRLVVETAKPVVNGPRSPVGAMKSARPVQTLSLPLIDDDQVKEIATIFAITTPDKRRPQL